MDFRTQRQMQREKLQEFVDTLQRNQHDMLIDIAASIECIVCDCGRVSDDYVEYSSGYICRDCDECERDEENHPKHTFGIEV